LPLGKRKDRLARLLARVRAGIAINEHTDENGAVVFLHACKMGLEGTVSKRLSAPYRSGRSTDWLKVKNPRQPGDDPGARRAMVDSAWPRSECRARPPQGRAIISNAQTTKHVQSTHMPVETIDRRQKWTRHVCWWVSRHPGP
jgi:hypothetical protein